MTMKRKTGAERPKRLKPTDRVMVRALTGDAAKAMEAIRLLRRASNEIRRGGHIDRWPVVHAGLDCFNLDWGGRYGALFRSVVPAVDLDETATECLMDRHLLPESVESILQPTTACSLNQLYGAFDRADRLLNCIAVVWIERSA